MLTFQEEKFPDIIDEMKMLFVDQWKEVGIGAVSEYSMTLNPDYNVYQLLYNNNMLHITTVRDDRKLVGHCLFILSTHTHSMGVMIAENDNLYLKKKYRKGLTGYKLIKVAVEQLKLKVKFITLCMDANKHFFPITNRLGFKLTEYKVSLEV